MLVFRHVIDSVVLIVLVMKLVSMITRNMEKLVLLLLAFKSILVQNHSKENIYCRFKLFHPILSVQGCVYINKNK